MTWTLALDALMAVLLATSIATTIVLNRRLTVLRDGRAELEQLTRNFREATDRADNGVVGLKISAQALQERIESARALADDLQFLIERGGGLADRLEADVRAARGPEVRAKRLEPASTDARAKARASQPQPRSAAERHLLAALRQGA